MRVDVHIRNEDLESALKLYIRRRLQFSLGRFAGEISRVRVHLEDLPGRSGAVDKSCRIRAQMLSSDRVLQREVADANLYIAIDLATERMSRVLERSLGDALMGDHLGEARVRPSSLDED